MNAVIDPGNCNQGKKREKMEIRKLERGRCPQHLGDHENTENLVYDDLAFKGITTGR